jgi:hypothetical protein
LIPVLLAIAATVSVGLPLAALLFPTASRTMLAALSWLYGCGVVFLTLFALSTIGIRWSAPAVAACLLIVTGLSIFALSRRRPAAAGAVPGRPVEGKAWQAAPFDLMTLITLTGFGLFATVAELSEWDFWAIWGLKGRVFLEAGGIDWRFLESPLNVFCHPDYPLLLPLNFDFVALLNGGWDDRWLGFLFIAFAASLLLLARELFLDELPRAGAALGTFIMASAACSHFVGLAETPLIACSGGGILLVRRGLRDEDTPSLRNGAILLGLAGSCKNEGLAMIASVLIALILVDPRRISRLRAMWPALAIPLPWLCMRAVHYLPTDLVTGSATQRVLSRIPELHLLLLTLARRVTYRGFWISLAVSWVVVAVAEVVAKRKSGAFSIVRRYDLFVIVAMGIQMAAYVATYLVTPADIEWHIGTSWSRVSEQLAVPLIYVTVVMLGRMLPEPPPDPDRLLDPVPLPDPVVAPPAPAVPSVVPSLQASDDGGDPQSRATS